MKTSTRHLDDEHMKLYEWQGGVMRPVTAEETRRPRRWHASYAVLALFTSLLVLGGCERQGPAEAAGERIDEAVEDVRDRAGQLYDEIIPEPGPAERMGQALDNAGETAAEKLDAAEESLTR